MKFLPDKLRIPLLLILIAVVAAIVIYRVGVHLSVPALNEEAASSFQQESAPAVNLPESAYTSDIKLETLKEPGYVSKRPLYFRAVFGKEGNKSMLGVVDESGGTDTGYDAAYVDENMNGDLTDDSVRKFARITSGSRKGELSPRFEFEGPFEGETSAKYALNIYSLTRENRGSVQEDGYYFFWYLDIKEWSYFFINGKMRLFSSAAEALKGTPVFLGGECKWEISSQIKNAKPVVSAGLKDGNGCTLRIVRRAGQTVSPTLTLIKDGKVEAEEKMKFG